MKTLIAETVESIGGAKATATLCGVTRQAVEYWVKQGRLPRTDYTGETDYAGILSKAVKGRPTAKQILDSGKAK